MSSVIEHLNTIFTRLFNHLLGSIAWLGPTLSLCLISAILGVVCLFVYGKFSNQNAIKDIKRRIHAAILEAIVFRSDLRLSLRAQAKMGMLSFLYIGRALPPFLVLVPLCLPLLAQLNRHYGAASLPSKQPMLVEVAFTPSVSLDAISLVSDDGVEVAGPLRDLASREALFRVETEVAGNHRFVLKAGDTEAATMTLASATPWNGVGVVSRASTHWISRLLFPHEDAWTIKPGMISEIKAGVPDASYSFFGLHLSWLTIFLLVSLATGFIASKFLGIEV